MRYLALTALALLVILALWLPGQTPTDPLSDGFRLVEVASVADATEQLYGQKIYMTHDMRPLSPTKFAGPAVTVMLKKEEHTEGSKASSGMLDAIDKAPAGSGLRNGAGGRTRHREGDRRLDGDRDEVPRARRRHH